jgi:predicted trehalose synthase
MATKTSIAKFLAPLAKLGKTALQKKYREVFGRPTRSDNVQHLRAAIAKRLHEQASPAAKKSEKTKATAPNTNATPRDARLPAVGTVLERVHGDATHLVRVVEDGFEYRGQRHRSLSAIAKEITGTTWNGFAFFGLAKKEAAR